MRRRLWTTFPLPMMRTPSWRNGASLAPSSRWYSNGLSALMDSWTTGMSALGKAVENCLHTYFQVGDISAVSLTGLHTAPFDDFAFGANGARRNGDPAPLRITQETKRRCSDHTATGG